MATCCNSDVFGWIQNLPPITQWKTNSMSICICSSSISSHPSLNLSVSKNLHSSTLSISIVADFNLPFPLWTSKPLNPNPMSSKLLDEETIYSLMINFIKDVLGYGSNNNSSLIRFPKLESLPGFKDIFNLSFLTLALLICIYEAPVDLRSVCLSSLKNQLVGCQSRAATKSLMRLLGSNLEEQWMRSMNLAITNWILELQATHRTLMKTPSPLFSYALATFGLWKVQLFCPVIAMDVENSSNPSMDDQRLLFSLNYHQLEGVIQFNYKVIVREKWIDVMLNIDNIRCDIIRLVNEALMKERGVGTDEKHFPSRVSLQVTPTLQSDILSVSVGKSTENPERGIEIEKGIEGSFDPPNSFLGLKVSAAETMTMSMKPWKFEQSVHGYSGTLNWFLHDSVDGREVVSSKPSKFALINPKAWFKDRYSSVYRPFTRQGGVIFAGDDYGEKIWWKIDKSAMGKTMEWEIRGAVSQVHCTLKRPSTVHMYSGSWPTSMKLSVHGLMFSGKNGSSTKRNVSQISCAKTPEATSTAKSNVPSDSKTQGSLEKTPRNATFPHGFEALVLEVCDDTEVAELKMKIGDFEMHLKRNVGATKAPLSNISPMIAPPIPSEPMNETAAVTPPPSAPKPSPEKPSPFSNASFGRSKKLAALEASGSNNYVLVPSPIVGKFRRGRTVKEKQLPPSCNEGDLIKEGQVIGFVDQFETELPIKSNVAGEVLKILFDDGDAVGYGDPLIAVLPSFHPIK
ncbi:Biotin/lipoyl attachment [Corchorus capsularis]|uniref:Biotin/lipoyl attachment n=1 Tax=Corchorus capsularis TaxID=210143 RepID=A0A1R3FW24_COCAP|nr:Biotin/lipoyl attachment [Corchorus capsularis]